MNQDQSQTGPVPQPAAELHAAVRGMPLPDYLFYRNDLWWQGENAQWETSLESSIAALALEGWYSRMLDEYFTRNELPWWKCEPGGGVPWRVSFAHNDETIADGPTKLHAMVAALKTLGVGA